MAKGMFIDVEGADGSGKTEQTKRLFERLQKEGYAASYFDFPQYESSRIGKVIGELLAGKHGDFLSVTPYLSSLPYAIDRATARPEIESALNAGNIIVSNRFTPSHAHQCAKLPPDEQLAFFAFIEGIEHEDLKIPRPDLVFYLSVPTDVSSGLILKKEKRGYLGDEARDLAERNIAHQDRTRAAYLRLAKEKGWHVIECAPQGTMRTRDEIHEDIWRIVKTKI
ncbi:thymidylate kinase [Candidatus Parcubacteria bacterium]|nr:MAG: thymidylate kinase [Candidatus Parcubacteria bacterium]